MLLELELGYVDILLPLTAGTLLCATGNQAITGDLVVSGAASSKKLIVSTKADGAAMTAAESGCTVFQNTNGATITLPATAAGLTYTFIWTGVAGQTFNISPNASDRIGGSIVDVADGNVVTAGNNGLGIDDKDLQLDSGSKGGDQECHRHRRD